MLNINKSKTAITTIVYQAAAYTLAFKRDQGRPDTETENELPTNWLPDRTIICNKQAR